MLSRLASKARGVVFKTNNSYANKTVSSPRFLSVATEKIGLDKLGINGPETIYHNLSYDDLFEHEADSKATFKISVRLTGKLVVLSVIRALIGVVHK